MIHGSIEGFDGRLNGNLDADENGDPRTIPIRERDVLILLKRRWGRVMVLGDEKGP
jgi:hypothetical protein